ncbi:MAG: energy transducer TonB [Bacteroidota bacterium]|nr:energy transducer TonB [Bacteroidota bacterium]
MRNIRIAFSLLFCIATAANSQQNGLRSRGTVPPTFSAPGPNERVHFSSSAQPQFATPRYPQVHRDNGVEAALEVMMYVTAEGEVVFAEVTVSTGDSLFEIEALQSAMASRFPEGYATVEGIPRDFTIAVPYYFLLSSDPEGYWHSRLELARIEDEYEVVMREFQGFLCMPKGVPESRLKASRRAIEAKVAAAKRLHRMIAEKKERAILRLRDEIASAQELLDRSGGASTAEQSMGLDRYVPQDRDSATVEIRSHPNGVEAAYPLNANGIDRLYQELEIKQSYL